MGETAGWKRGLETPTPGAVRAKEGGVSIVDLRQRPEHVQVLAEWHQDEWAHLNPGETLAMRVQRMQSYLGRAFVPSMFVFEEEGRLAGSSAIVECDMATQMRWTPWLASVYVSPEFRRRGIGAALVRHVMVEARTAGFKTLYLYTPDQERFYTSLGWKTVVREPYLGVDVTVMRAIL